MSEIQQNTPKRWHQVFRPGGFPIHNYVKRHDLIEAIKNFVLYGSKPLLEVTGYSGIGKTVLVKDVIQNKLKESPDGGDWKLLVLEATWFNNSAEGFRKSLCGALGLTSTQEERKKEFNIIGKIFGYGQSATNTTQDEVDEQDILLALHHKVVMIDDFHRLSRKGQDTILAYIHSLTNHLIQAKQDSNFRFIIVYIPYKMPNLSMIHNELPVHRVQPLGIPLWNEHELEDIARVTFRENNSCLTNAGELAKYVYGLPSLMQQLCLDYCLEYHPDAQPTTVLSIKERLVPLILTKLANLMWEQYGGDNFYADITATKTRSSLEHGQVIKSKLDHRTGNIYQMIWYVLSLPRIDGQVANLAPIKTDLIVPISTLQSRLREFTDASRDTIDNIDRYLDKIANHNGLLYQQKLEQATGQEYTPQEQRVFLDPLFEYHAGNYGDSSLTINNPEFLFALAHAEAHKSKFN
jgi:hypothetical protein